MIIIKSMKNQGLVRSMLLFCFLFVSACTTVESQSSSVSSEDDPSEDNLRNNIVVIKRFTYNAKQKSIRGICFISGENYDYLEFPCNNITLQLKDAKGFVEEADTDSGGRFQFTVPKNKTYILSAKSEKYRTVSTKIEVSPGADILIRLVAKDSK